MQSASSRWRSRYPANPPAVQIKDIGIAAEIGPGFFIPSVDPIRRGCDEYFPPCSYFSLSLPAFSFLLAEFSAAVGDRRGPNCGVFGYGAAISAPGWGPGLFGLFVSQARAGEDAPAPNIFPVS